MCVWLSKINNNEWFSLFLIIKPFGFLFFFVLLQRIFNKCLFTCEGNYLNSINSYKEVFLL